MRRLLRRLLGALLVALAVVLVGAKLWLDGGGPYLEALPAFDHCAASRAARMGGDPQEAIELAEAGGCEAELASARREWDAFLARALRCLGGVWTGRGEDAFGVACAVASDVVVLGDVRDLARQGMAWLHGDDPDEVLAALSAAGIVLTLTPQVDAGVSLLKVARRAGSLGERLGASVARLARERAWRPLAGLLGDAGRISLEVGPAGAARALAYADDADELAALARFVESAPNALLGLRWGGKGVARVADAELYSAAMRRGPAGVELAVARGGRALLARQPLIVLAAKSVWKSADAASSLVAFLIRWAKWPWVGGAAALLGLTGLAYFFSGRKRRPRVA